MSEGNAAAAGPLAPPPRYLAALTELTVGVGANIQPGQVVGITVESGQEAIARAVAEAAYRRGAKYVDPWLFDPFIKHSRLRHAPPDTLSYVPPWVGGRVLALGEANAARISFQGPVEPWLMDDVDPDRLGLDMMPRLRESNAVTRSQQTNWTMVPFPNPKWAAFIHPDLPVEQAHAKLWEQIAQICRLEEPDPTAAWVSRLEELEAHAERMNQLGLESLHFVGPGTDLSVGLLPSSRWVGGREQTLTGILHAANLPTEELYTAPDPLRVEGQVRATKPLFIPGSAAIEGLRVRFEGGRAVAVDADRGGGILRTITRRDEGACRLGEVALVDRESRVGASGGVFYSTLLDENAASHIAVGSAYPFCVGAEQDRPRANVSGIHIDFIIGSSEVAVDGLRADGTLVPLLREGAWQI